MKFWVINSKIISPDKEANRKSLWTSLPEEKARILYVNTHCIVNGKSRPLNGTEDLSYHCIPNG